MNILNKLNTFFKAAFSSAYIMITMLVIITVLVILLFSKCSSLKEEKLNHDRDVAMYENNLVAQNDSLTIVYDKKLDKAITEKTAYLVKSVDDLKKYNTGLYNEFKDLENMVAGIKSNVSIIIPALTSEINKSEVDTKDSTKFTIPWSFRYKDAGLRQTLVGRTQFKILNNKPAIPIASLLDTNKFDISLKYDVVERDGKYIVQASSPSKLVKFTELDGALMLDRVVPEANAVSPWGFGPYVGVGLNTDIKGQNSQFGWSIGVALHYNLFNKMQGGKGIKALFEK